MEQFQALLCRVDQLSSAQQIQLFTAGLSEWMRIDVELQDPPNLQMTVNLARAHERRA